MKQPFARDLGVNPNDHSSCLHLRLRMELERVYKRVSMPLLASFPPTVELAKLIASNVDDGKTLRNLSVVDKGFYLATRPSIWSELCAPFRKRTHRTDPLEPFRRIQTALDSDVEKAKSVKVCRLPITVNNQSILLNILSRLPNLEVLIIAQRLPPYTWADFDAHHSVLREFYESCDELPVLNHIHRLDLQVTHEWHRELLKLLPKTPNLRSLYVEDRRQDVITNVNLPTWTVQLSHLDDLHISVDRHSFHVLARLCAKAPHLQHLEITWKRFSGQVPDRHAIQIFQSCQCLTSLFNDFASDIQCFDRGLWETIFVDGVVEKFSKLRTVAMLLPEVSATLIDIEADEDLSLSRIATSGYLHCQRWTCCSFSNQRQSRLSGR